MEQSRQHSVGIIMNGVTGRMGLNQHLRRLSNHRAFGALYPWGWEQPAFDDSVLAGRRRSTPARPAAWKAIRNGS